MKQKDLPILAAIVIVSSILSLVITKTLFVTKSSKVLTAEKVDEIKPDFQQTDAFIFNKDAVNPTELIRIGDTPNSSSR